ncbi:MAG: TadE/TadG family type IV pilus assembly protein [Propionibacteriaceae bacterium]|nr:TadE/TadG family type IV pilus assembly protein [Propionibacteriaceae bacterium]
MTVIPTHRVSPARPQGDLSRRVRARRTGRVRDERGLSPAVEASLLFPALGLIIALIIFGGRLESSRQGVQAAAAEAARSASISRSPAEAISRARAAAAAALAAENLRCATSNLSVDTSQMSKAPGLTGEVSVSLTCVVSMSEISLPGIPGSVTLSTTQSSVIDRYRER